MSKRKKHKTDYVVSNYGLVLNRKKPYNNFVEQELDNEGNPIVNLTIRGETKAYRVDMLVAQAYVPNPENKEQIRHIDGDKQNNFMLNLEWI